MQLVKHFGWTWVGVIAGDDAYGRGGANIFADEVGCTAINKEFKQIKYCNFVIFVIYWTYCEHKTK